MKQSRYVLKFWARGSNEISSIAYRDLLHLSIKKNGEIVIFSFILFSLFFL